MVVAAIPGAERISSVISVSTTHTLTLTLGEALIRVLV